MSAVLALLAAGCASNEPIEPNERLDREYVTGSNLPKKSRPGEVTTYDKEAIQRARDAAVQAPPGPGHRAPEPCSPPDTIDRTP
ncbi:MAG: hypothetical protein IPJ28_18950 [Betaproteobacteria bacterium]|nr:hypothetical protein [Betaproteobacteria bacterium]